MSERSAARVLMAATVAACAAQLLWFGSKVIQDIDFDGLAYTGIAERVKLWRWQDSVNAFRSPLISWLIAIVPRMSLLHAGKLVTIVSFIFCVVLVYIFSFYLWHSKLASASAALLMVLARGVAFFAVAFVTPDFLFTALVTGYFLAVLICLQRERTNWWSVGAIHGIAFLAKAIALPWLAVCTIISACLSPGAWKGKLRRIASAAVIPAVIAILWGSVLRTQYGVFTLGSQFKVNLLQWTLRGAVPEPLSRYKTLSDVAGHMGRFNDDPLPPGSWEWSYRPSLSLLVPRILRAEIRNVPGALKELSIMVTPGILLGGCILIFSLHKHRRGTPEWTVAIAIAAGSIVLVLAYSMLVIDARYLFPLAGLWISLAARYLWIEQELEHSRWRVAAVGLTMAGVAFSLLSSSSPLRRQTRDWQSVCRQAGEALRVHGTATTVSIGSGPFPDHGVGWEAGYTSTYFAHARLLAAAERLPIDADGLKADVMRAAPGAVLVWDVKQQSRASVQQALNAAYPDSTAIIDPALGDVGLILYRRSEQNLVTASALASSRVKAR